ncbi:Hypothetical protein PHPALM_19435, partial [Phytophthora palmivora]
MLILVLTDLKMCCQIAETNFLSRSDTMLVGIPYNFQIFRHGHEMATRQAIDDNPNGGDFAL